MDYRKTISIHLANVNAYIIFSDSHGSVGSDK